MTFLTQTLEGSRLLRPWVALAEIPAATLDGWLAKSSLARLFLLIRQYLARFCPTGSVGQLAPIVGNLLSSLLLQLLPWGVGLLFIGQTFLGTGLIGAGVVGLFLVVVLAGLLTGMPLTRKKITIIDGLVLCFLASSALSTAFSSFFHTSVVGLAKMLVFMSGYAVFRVVSAGGCRPVIGLMWLLAALGLGESLIGFYQHAMHIQPLATWTDPTINPELRMDRIFGTLQPSNPNLLAGFLVPCLASSTGLALLYLKKKTWLLSIGLLAASLAILYALVLTGSRGGFLAIASMLACLFGAVGHLVWHEQTLRRFRWMKPAWLTILLITLLVLGGGILTSEKIRARVTSIFAMREDSSISYRLNVYDSALRMARDNPLVGIGPGNGTFKLVYGLYMVPGYAALGAYSVPLEILVEQGAIGLAIFLSLLLILIIRTALALDRPDMRLERKLLAVALLMGILGSLAYGLFDTIWYRPSVNLLFWFMVAALAALSEPPVEANVFQGLL